MTGEGRFLIHAFLLGIWITFFYDFFKVLRRAIPHKAFLVSLEDLIFWLCCGLQVFLLMYYESDGRLRWFAVLGALTGMFLYKRLASPYFVKYTSWFLGKLLKGLHRFINVLLRPVVFLTKKVRKLLRHIKFRLTKRKKIFRMKLRKRLIHGKEHVLKDEH